MNRFVCALLILVADAPAFEPGRKIDF